MRLNTFLCGIVAAWSLFSSILCAEPSATEFANAVVKIDSEITANARTGTTLGYKRAGSGVVIDASGLVVTVGYLVLEAQSIAVTFNTGEQATASVLANDHATGLALLRVPLPAEVQPIPIGDSASVSIDQDVVVLKHGGVEGAHVATIADIRGFAGSWEYYIDRALYTVPETRNFSGAALIDRDARLIGIGSLLLSDIYAGINQRARSGNLFIPIQHLINQMGVLLTSGVSAGHDRPWLGVALNETRPDIEVVRIAADSPAERAGLQAGDALIAINNTRVSTMQAFYEALWNAGDAGVDIELLIARENKVQPISIKTAGRDQWLVR